MIRGNGGQSLFEHDEDQIKFLEILAETKEKTKYEIDLYAYCLMGNHVHLLIKENNMDLGDFMRRATAQYALWMNYKYERKGHVFQDRFKSEPAEDDRYLLTVFRYILQNPTKAGLSKGVFDYKWSSWKSYEHNHEYPVGLTDVTYIINIFGKTRKEAIERMKRFVQKKNNDSCMDIETGIRLTDNELRDRIKREFPEIKYQSLNQLPKEDRNEALRKIKSIEGAAKLQIARITGLGAKVVQNA
ncbi:transposase [Tindallia californiensis]|uniref:REP element-mobilizing transposase RayT n=1 Tax=Tindallia californiensis TaxID=159292 RepID=A0A1H3NHZ0_9FIRM|nr:transposase [Tindallia californiensis]SDY88363.1 REP element-mobilizing transposase RayT [Tindallia californiensis]